MKTENRKPSGLKKPSDVQYSWNFFGVPDNGDVLPEAYLVKQVTSHRTTRYQRKLYVLDRVDSYYSDGRIVVNGTMRPLNSNMQTVS